MKLIIIFNTCGISGKDNSAIYINHINGILNQNFDDFRVVLSSCLNSNQTRNSLLKHFGNKISYSFIDQLLPVNITFNKSIQVASSYFGEAEAYASIDSGVDISHDLNSIKKLFELHKTGDYGITASRIEDDSGYWLWFGDYDKNWSPHIPATANQEKECANKMFANGNFEIPLGKTINQHLQIFNPLILKNFDNRLTPDIFASHSTEGLYTYITASIGKKFVIHKDVIAKHSQTVDGGSSGFRPEREGVPGYQHTISFAKKKIMDIIFSEESKEVGFGYEECQKILMHNPSKFDENGYPKDAEKLKKFLLNNFYLSKEELDYNNIHNIFLK